MKYRISFAKYTVYFSCGSKLAFNCMQLREAGIFKMSVQIHDLDLRDTRWRGSVNLKAKQVAQFSAPCGQGNKAYSPDRLVNVAAHQTLVIVPVFVGGVP